MSADAHPALPVLVYDGDCAFCSSTLRFAQRWIRRMPVASPYQRTDLARLGLDEQQCEQAVQYVARDHRVHSAHDAVAATLLAAGKGWWVLGALMHLPGLHWLAGLGYRWVSRNRHRLPGGTPACSLNEPG